jgi:rubrerythrin
MILMKPESFAGLNTIEGLKRALQEAIELEHATIPPYLYALFSLEPGNNTEITQLVDSVVKEEMAHMALACNILNAIGGEPELDTPRVIPTYPGHLPGAVEDQLIIHLRPFSIAQVEKTFMVIEEPEEPLVIPDEAMPERRTIGAFYAIIKREIEALGQSIFKGDPTRQVTGGFHEIIAVTDVKSASAAIETIVEQGEGTSKSPLGDQAGDELAHYYRFAEIVHGKKLIPAQGQEPPWRYDGEAIPFDAAHVYPVVDDPRCASYPAGSPARHACEECNYTYTSLLKTLHAVFNGAPGNLRQAINQMNELATQAENLMTIKLPTAGNAGPSFEYQPTPPTAA